MPLAALLVGCAAAPPRELTDARAKIDLAQQSEAAELDPTDVELAKDSLKRAERAYADEGDSAATRGLAYVAAREADLAMTRASTRIARDKGDASQDELATNAAAARAADRDILTRQGEDLMAIDRALHGRTQRDHDAELRMKDALNRLAPIASVRDDPRGMVLTMPGDVLFESACAMLVGTAEERLNQIARALIIDRSARIRIEGHTDLDGTEAQRRTLSAARAIAIANFLVSRGVSADRIISIGRGSSVAIADNATSEGRARNRRVEIIVETSTTLAVR